ncbi:MAG: hypothetical protein PHO37_15350 [Kiritimatiellae bacterium]|nr:hypothetical protein [Kiritimatiellia bacterium]
MELKSRLPAIALLICLPVCLSHGDNPSKPLMKDFIGINGHFQFKPSLYRQTCRLVRNYHNMDWDVKQPGGQLTFPICRNQVDWEKHVYGQWVEHGFEVDLCAQFGSFGTNNKDYTRLWHGQEEWIYKYGYEMARHFGPSGEKKLVTSIEIGNEPGNGFDDTLYRKLFLQMAKGIREGDPQMKIVTATAHSGPADKYSKSLEETFASPEIMALYDVINVHVYAIKPAKTGQSPWERSYPEDPLLDYLKIVDAAIAFRDQKAAKKQVWITEFGYDSCTSAAMSKREGWAEKLNWSGVTDTQQAQYIVRSLLCFAERDITRAYIYYFNDNDEASVHAASGLTRNFQPKPSFWAVKHLYETLGEYRLIRVVLKQTDNLYVHEFQHGSSGNLHCWVVWSPTASNREQMITLRNAPGKLLRAERMALNKSGAEKINAQSLGADAIQLLTTESPSYLMFDKTHQ